MNYVKSIWLLTQPWETGVSYPSCIPCNASPVTSPKSLSCACIPASSCVNVGKKNNSEDMTIKESNESSSHLQKGKRKRHSTSNIWRRTKILSALLLRLIVKSNRYWPGNWEWDRLASCRYRLGKQSRSGKLPAKMKRMTRSWTWRKPDRNLGASLHWPD